MKLNRKPKVLSWRNLPSRPPWILTAVVYLLLDRWQAAGWVWGAVGTVLFILWVASVWQMIIEDDIDIFKDAEFTKAAERVALNRLSEIFPGRRPD